MIIDCYHCQARGAGCADCAATHVLGDTVLGDTVMADTALGDDCTSLDLAEMRALSVLANLGLIPPLRYAPRLARAS